MRIVYCESCGKRVSPADLDSGRCVMQGTQVLKCATCNDARPQSATAVTAAQAAPAAGATPPSRRRPPVPAGARTAASMVSPPGEEMMNARRRRSSGQQAMSRRSTPSGTRPGSRIRRPTSSDGLAVRRRPGSTPDRGTGRRRQLPAGDTGAPMARRGGEAIAAKDPTMMYMIIGAALLVFGIILVAYAMMKGPNKTAATKKKPATTHEDAPVDPAPRRNVERVGPLSGRLNEVDNKRTMIDPETNKRPGPKVSLPDIQSPTPDPTPAPTPKSAVAGWDDVPADVPRMVATKIVVPPVIDGKLTDLVWNDAAAFNMIHIDGSTDPLTTKSRVKVVAGKVNLIIGARFEESEMSQIIMPNRDRDTSAWRDDCIEIFMLPGLDPNGLKYQLVINIAGNVWDGVGIGHAIKPEDWNLPDLKYAIHKADTYWSIEVAIPFSSIPGVNEKPLWRFNVTRNRPIREGVDRAGEVYSWSNLKVRGTHTPGRYGVLAIESLGGKLPKK